MRHLAYMHVALRVIDRPFLSTREAGSLSRSLCGGGQWFQAGQEFGSLTNFERLPDLDDADHSHARERGCTGAVRLEGGFDLTTHRFPAQIIVSDWLYMVLVLVRLPNSRFLVGGCGASPPQEIGRC